MLKSDLDEIKRDSAQQSAKLHADWERNEARAMLLPVLLRAPLAILFIVTVIALIA